MVSIVYPFLVAVIGALVYSYADKKLAEIGRILFFVGAFWTVYLLCGRQFQLGR